MSHGPCLSNTYGGGIHHTAIIGCAPESREWTPDDPVFKPIIDPTARIEAYVTIDSGTERPTTVGERAWIMKGCHLGHDVFIRADAELAPHTVLCGHVVVGRGARLGINVSVTPYVWIGEGARIGAGSVVIKDVPSGQFWAGNPARYIRLVDA